MGGFATNGVNLIKLESYKLQKHIIYIEEYKPIVPIRERPLVIPEYYRRPTPVKREASILPDLGFNMDLGLVGENYDPVKKGLYYYQHSIRQNNVFYQINKRTGLINYFKR
jgi:hypothetical protein